jgi:creatinine amidohydrolase/Fe(II)-dependent formamide hydrolase-like protein
MTNVKKIASILLWLLSLLALPSFAQIYDMREMVTVDIRNLDLDRTAVIIPAGILEQHGPYLPSYTDGYRNEYFAQRIAESIVQRDGWAVLIFPPIPLGVGGANQIAKRHVFPGTYHVHYSTLRAMFLDLASELGEAGFQWVFVISHHGAQRHQLALDQASDFFTDTYRGQMVYLSGLIPDKPVSPHLNLSDKELSKNGLDPHGGMSETAKMLFIRPDLVRPGYQNAVSQTGNNWGDLIAIGAKDGWPGYYGAHDLATVSRLARLMQARLAELTDLVLRILDGFDHRNLKRKSDSQLEDDAIREYNADGLEHASKIQQMQQQWLNRQGIQ